MRNFLKYASIFFAVCLTDHFVNHNFGAVVAISIAFAASDFFWELAEEGNND